MNIILHLFNKVWEVGKLPSSWKHGVVVPVAKPEKDHSKAVNYRPIALTSNLCKIMERMVIARINDTIEKKNLLCPHQSGFRKGRSTMDSRIRNQKSIYKLRSINWSVFLTWKKHVVEGGIIN